MEIKKGIPVSPGVAIKEALVLDSEEFRIPVRYVPAKAVPSEARRFKEALARVKRDVQGVERQESHRGITSRRCGAQISSDGARVTDLH